MPHTDPAQASLHDNVRVGAKYAFRAVRLRCPECGVSPVFVPLKRTRSWHNWVTPLLGCPKCDFAYEREQGYFLVAVWGIHYFVVAGFGMGLGLLIDAVYRPPLGWLAWGVSVPTVLAAVLFIRHAKCLYLAADHFFDPHVRKPAKHP